MALGLEAVCKRVRVRKGGVKKGGEERKIRNLLGKKMGTEKEEEDRVKREEMRR